MMEIGLGLGSNIGDKAGYVREAASRLVTRGLVTELTLSPLYRTAPWGVVDQDWFVNACAVGVTTLSPEAMLQAVKALEVEIGRTTTIRWGPRVIDIDILYCGGEARDTPDLGLPHRELVRRGFVLIPLAQLRPDLLFGGRRVADLAAALDDGSVVPLEPSSA